MIKYTYYDQIPLIPITYTYTADYTRAYFKHALINEETE